MEEVNEVVRVKKTIGEQRVRTDFNVSGNDAVTLIKEKSAELINLCQAMRNDEAVAVLDESKEAFHARCGEKLRLVALAQTAYEEAAMWAVKAATA